MALLFVDSFDHYTTPAQKWIASQRQGIAAGQGRLLAAGYTETNGSAGTGGSLQKLVATPVATLIAGAGVKWTRPEVWKWRFQEGTTVHIEISVNGAGKIEVRRGAAGTLLATGTATMVANVYSHVEVKVNVHATTGSVEVRVNGVVDSTFSGNTRNGGTTGLLDSFVQITPYGGATGNGFCYLDDFFLMNTAGSLNNDFKGDCRVEALYPNANGNSSGFTGSDGNSTDNYALVDENPPNSDTDYVESSTVGTKDTYGYSNISSTIGTVHGVQILPFAKKTDAGSRAIATVARSGITEAMSADLPLLATYGYYPTIVERDPATVAAWTIAAVNAAEFGVAVTA